MAWYIFPQFIMEKGPKISSGSLENTIAILPKLQFFIGVRSYRMSSVLLSKEPCVCVNPIAPMPVQTFGK